jgi:hypothetical protein
MSPSIKLIKLWPQESLELKNKLNLSRPRPLEKLILPGWACWRLMLLVEVGRMEPLQLQDPTNRIPAGWLGTASVEGQTQPAIVKY